LNNGSRFRKWGGFLFACWWFKNSRLMFPADDSEERKVQALYILVGEFPKPPAELRLIFQ
jgi:hypothetical protein